MNVTPIIFFDLVITILILSISLVVVVFYFSNNFRKNHAIKETDLLDEARRKTIKMLDDANSKALDIINKANLYSSTTKADFDDELKNVRSLQIKAFEKASMDFVKLYQEILNDLKSKNIEVFQNISKDIETSTDEEIKSFKDSIKKETISLQDIVRKKVDEQYTLIKKDIDMYKQEELKKVDKEIFEVLKNVSKQVLGKALNLSEHEDLIIKSLEKAKKEGVFRE